MLTGRLVGIGSQPVGLPHALECKGKTANLSLGMTDGTKWRILKKPLTPCNRSHMGGLSKGKVQKLPLGKGREEEEAHLLSGPCHMHRRTCDRGDNGIESTLGS